MSAAELSPGTPPAGAPRRDELHLRLVDLRQAANAEPAMRRLLAPDEIDRAGRFQFDAGRIQFVVTRGWLRVILARCLGAAPERLQFSYGTRGKPALTGDFRDAELSFNISHSGDYALIALTGGRPVGVDIERVRPMPDFESIAAGYFSETETRALTGFPEGDRLRAFFTCWTRKEAFMKATGEGMGIALDGFSVTLHDREERTISTPAFPGRGSEPWTVRGLSLVPGYEAAVSVEGAGSNVTAWLDSVSA